MDPLENLVYVAFQVEKEIKAENVHCVHLVKKEKRENLEETGKMDFLEIEDHQEEEVCKGRLEKMDLQECPDRKDQWYFKAFDNQSKSTNSGRARKPWTTRTERR